MENPIKFEELIDVNDEFVRLTAQVVQLNDALKDIKTSASGLKESLSGLSGANGASGIGSAASEADRLAKAQKELTFALSETGRQLADILDREFPIESAIVPPLIEFVVKELLGAEYRPKDDSNDANDALADLATFLKLNTKSNLAKALE